VPVVPVAVEATVEDTVEEAAAVVVVVPAAAAVVAAVVPEVAAVVVALADVVVVVGFPPVVAADVEFPEVVVELPVVLPVEVVACEKGHPVVSLPLAATAEKVTFDPPTAEPVALKITRGVRAVTLYASPLLSVFSKFRKHAAGLLA